MKQISRTDSAGDVLDSIKAHEKLRPNLLEEAQDLLPRPFCYDVNNFKAFVLGADPSNFSNSGRPVLLNTVFGIGSGNASYFRGHLKNLKQLGLRLEDVYVQNIVRNYMVFETSEKPKVWREFAALWVDELKQEFDSADPKAKIPVLVTAEAIYKFLVHENSKKQAAIDFYECKVPIPINSDENRLKRPLIPFYRHPKYQLAENKWPQYTAEIKRILEKS